MNLKALVKTVSDWQNKTAVEIAAVLNTQSVEVRDDQMYTWAGVAVAIGSDNADALRVFMETHNLGWAVHQLGGSGIQLSYPATQAMLSGLIGAGVVGADTLMWIGIHYISPYVNDGGVGEVTDVEVQTVLDSIASDDAVIALNARIVNATALANERMPASQDKAATWARCWEDAI